MKRFSTIISILILSTLLTSMLAACGPKLATAPTITTPLVAAYDQFNQKFSPFFSETAVDADVAGLTQLGLMTTDRLGGIVYNAIKGETHEYNGTDYVYKGPADISVEYDETTDTTKYTATLKKGMKFSDGVEVTADDIIFTYYTFLDPSYVGSTSLNSYKIIGVSDYQTQTTSEVYDKYTTMVDAIYAAGPDHVWAATDTWTEEQQQDFWTRVQEGVAAEVQKIVNYVLSEYIDYGPDYFGMTGDEINANEGTQVAFSMAMWGYGERSDSGAFIASPSGTSYDLTTTFPTQQNYMDEILANYENDLAAAFPYESADGTDVLANVKTAFIGYWGPLDEAMGGAGVPNISGIKKIDKYTVEVTTEGYEAPAVYSILGIPVTPMHYYGDAAQYNYDNNQFGFPFGDLSKQQSLTPTPMGAGPYMFVKYENRVVTFAANPNYFKGCPKIAEIQFKETESAEIASAVQTGTVDVGNLNASRTGFEEVASYNSNGEMTGDVITTSLVDNLGYGYTGINAKNVSVGGEPGSQASKDLRKALATVLAVYREVAVNSYYGNAAVVIQYPITNTSWAAPQPTDEGYKIAFSTDVDGNPIYTADMTEDQKYAAAEQAALGFLEAAGYTISNGKAVAAPAGAKLEYEVMVSAGGTGDHPGFAVLTGAAASLAKLGITLKINDIEWASMMEAVDAGTQELFTMAWQVTIDPDMYQVYYSGNVVGAGGTDSNNYYVQDPTLDQLIIDARKSDDQAYRKAIYKQALDIIADWAVEIPLYQRQNCIIFSTQRINIATITPDITTYWGWLNDIELLEMN